MACIKLQLGELTGNNIHYAI